MRLYSGAVSVGGKLRRIKAVCPDAGDADYQVMGKISRRAKRRIVITMRIILGECIHV